MCVCVHADFCCACVKYTRASGAVKFGVQGLTYKTKLTRELDENTTVRFSLVCQCFCA
jgi:hypothetical protein